MLQLNIGLNLIKEKKFFKDKRSILNSNCLFINKSFRGSNKNNLSFYKPFKI